MGSLRLTLSAGAVVAAAATPIVAGAAHPAHAEDTAAGVSVSPSGPVPGSDIELQARGCTGRTAVARSAVFVADAQLTVREGVASGDGSLLYGETTIRSTVTAGTYEIKIACDGREDKAKGSVTVAERSAATTGPAAPSVPPSPTAPVSAGGGGAAAQLAASHPDVEEAAGPGKVQAVVGLVLAAVAAVAVAFRSVRRRRSE
ncbi:hypothetical protein [Streptomyces jeddahensis]|uniref:Uncharacterized protein n=1 Tax=Streptomyces jeddahensis TaxID=1716141 RepID=A0A177HTA1_9ACTN|nr:hypothetical protein [Streptomyces jeddahensis]OAH13388.1 hypothetical protein STSP_32770 [Streptomyces jeddahensis]